jgi:hypothetical protein
LRISRERARQIEKKVVDKLKAFLGEQFPDLEDIQVLFKKLNPENKKIDDGLQRAQRIKKKGIME